VLRLSGSRLAVLLLLLLLQLPQTYAQNTAAQAAAEKKKLEAIKKEMQTLSEEQKKLQVERDAASQTLRNMDALVASASRTARTSQQQMLAQEEQLIILEKQKKDLDEKLVKQKTQLANLIRSAYAQGDHAALELLLSQDKVNQSERALTYHNYLQSDQKEQILQLRTELAALVELTEKVKQQKVQIQQSKLAQEKNLASLSLQRVERDKLLAQLDSQYKTKNARLSALGRDEKNLNQLLDKLQSLMAKKAADEARAKARALAKANAKPNTKSTTKTSTKASAGAVTGIKATSATRVNSSLPRTPNIPMGPMRLPVQGTIVAGFGGTMPDGHRSSGLLINGAMGAEVRAASAGRVVYADWLKGYGLLAIVEHGNGWMSLYAYNDSLLKNVGDQVQANDAIATLGRSGGQSVPALYFELRQNGQPKDPRSWLKP
jgi:murein hydrolase activator